MPTSLVVALVLALGCSPAASISTAIPTMPASISPPSATLPAPSPTSLTDPVGPIPTAGISTIYRSWTRSDMPIAIPGIYGGNAPNDVVGFEGGLLAVGGVNAGCCDGSFSTDTRALVWASADGATWDLVGDSPAFDLGYMSAVAARPGRVVAVGSLQLESGEYEGQVDPRGAAWVSTDGRDWRLVEGLPFFNDIVATVDGFVASTLAGAHPEIWGSDDGRAWARLAGSAELGEGSIDRLLVVDGGGVVAVGRSEALGVEPPSFGPANAAVWRSPDGRAWSRVADEDAFKDGWMRDVAERDGRLVGIGSGDNEAGSSVWISDDGSAWRRPTTALAADDTFVVHVIGGRAGFIAVGSTGDEARSVVAWTSLDGEAWARVPARSGLDGSAAVPAGWMALDDGSIAAVGSRWDLDAWEQAPVAWLIR